LDMKRRIEETPEKRADRASIWRAAARYSRKHQLFLKEVKERENAASKRKKKVKESIRCSSFKA